MTLKNDPRRARRRLPPVVSDTVRLLTGERPDRDVDAGGGGAVTLTALTVIPGPKLAVVVPLTKLVN